MKSYYIQKNNKPFHKLKQIQITPELILKELLNNENTFLKNLEKFNSNFKIKEIKIIFLNSLKTHYLNNQYSYEEAKYIGVKCQAIYLYEEYQKREIIIYHPLFETQQLITESPIYQDGVIIKTFIIRKLNLHIFKQKVKTKYILYKEVFMGLW